ncbi:thioredoxin family protein (Thioredoxin_7 domain) [Arcobacter acticola]|uniref:Thioredoxin family protein (Thioredoxin_7 domain) n=2 Tax=Arcobacter acticola TaxID=1849015 RepID=A0A6M8EX06_9BACT|nr:thioredoxin family protein (Thioredoxin_7 domain) [Arcobacter acticola]
MGIFYLMYKIILILILLLSNLFSNNIQNNISWYSSYDKALEIAQKEKKNMMLFIASSKDKNSNEILRKHFQNQDYINYLNTNFISVLITVEHKTSYPIELFYTTNFPSIFFASYKDESFLTHPIYDFKSKEEFIDILKSINIK